MKTQMKFQKIFALVTLITAALAAVLALIFCSGLLDAIRQYSYIAERLEIGADDLYIYSQGINGPLLVMAIVLIVTAVVLYIFGCNKMRNYYITNYIAIGLYVVYAVVFALFLIIVSCTCLSYSTHIDYEAWREYEAQTDAQGHLIRAQYYNDSVFTLALGIIMSIVILAEAAGWVFNLIWKLKLMKGEKALLEQGAVKDTEEMEVA